MWLVVLILQQKLKTLMDYVETFLMNVLLKLHNICTQKLILKKHLLREEATILWFSILNYVSLVCATIHK